MQTIRAWALVGVVCIASTSSTIRAETSGAGSIAEAPSASPELPAQAHLRYQDGVEAYRKGRYKEAIDAFIAADLLIPSAALSFNIARAYEKLQDPATAVIWYRDYLHRAGFLPDRAAIEQRVSTLETVLSSKTLQRLSVASSPIGATLALDGKPLGNTPWSGQIPLGSHELELGFPGYVPLHQTVWLTPDSPADVRVALAPSSMEPSREVRAIRSPRDERAVPFGRDARARQPSRAKPNASAIKDEKPENSRGNGVRTLAYVAAAAGTAAVAGGVVFEVLRRRTESQAAGDGHQVSFAEKYDTMVNQQTASRVLLGVGGGLLVTSGTLLLVTGGSAKGHPAAISSLSLGCVPTGCGAHMSGRF